MRIHSGLTFLLAILAYGLIWLLTPIDITASWFRLDKIGHFWGFFCLTFIIHQLTRLPMKYLAVGLITYSGCTEIGQNFLGFRNGTWDDFYADVTGVVSYTIILFLVNRLLSRTAATDNQ